MLEYSVNHSSAYEFNGTEKCSDSENFCIKNQLKLTAFLVDECDFFLGSSSEHEIGHGHTYQPFPVDGTNRHIGPILWGAKNVLH